MKLRRILFAPARQAAMAALAPLEAALVRDQRFDALGPPCFVVGPPRSGTTLFYEALVTRLRFAYLSNLAHRFYRTPAAATRLGRGAVLSWRGEFASELGHIEGWGSPSEGGWIWRRWIPEESRLTAADAAGRPVRAMRGTVAAVSRTLGAPFICKNVMHSVQLPLIDAVYPGALFLEVRRDASDTVRSIVRARARGRADGPDAAWFSVRPSGWESAANASAVGQACFQVTGVRADIEGDARALGPDRHLAIEYADVCERPRKTFERIETWLRARGVRVEIRGELPERFAESGGKRLDPAQEAEMAQCLAGARG